MTSNNLLLESIEDNNLLYQSVESYIYYFNEGIVMNQKKIQWKECKYGCGEMHPDGWTFECAYDAVRGEQLLTRDTVFGFGEDD